MRPAIDRQPFDALLRKLGEVFGKPVTESMVSAYWEVLRNHHLSAIEQRAKHHMATGKHFPRPVEITPEPEERVQPQNTGPGNHERLDACLMGWYGNQLAGGIRFRGRFFDAPDLSGKVRANHGHEFTAVEAQLKDGSHVRITMADVERFEAETRTPTSTELL
jgi:hypothetical protein